MSEQDEHPLLKQIRARAPKPDNTSTTAPEPRSWAEDRAAQQPQRAGSIRDLINAKRTKRSLSEDEQRTVDALQDILAQLTAGKHVQNRRLQTWLSAEQFKDMDAEWDEQKDLRSDLKQKPDDIKDYEDRLRRATLLHNRAEHYSNKGNHTQAKRFVARCESELERLLERYNEITTLDISMSQWFDRDIDVSTAGEASADIASIPRVITSNSIEAHKHQGLGSRKRSKRDVKIDVVERALDALIYE